MIFFTGPRLGRERLKTDRMSPPSFIKVVGATFFLVFRGMEPRASVPSTTDGTLCYG